MKKILSFYLIILCTLLNIEQSFASDMQPVGIWGQHEIRWNNFKQCELSSTDTYISMSKAEEDTMLNIIYYLKVHDLIIESTPLKQFCGSLCSKHTLTMRPFIFLELLKQIATLDKVGILGKVLREKSEIKDLVQLNFLELDELLKELDLILHQNVSPNVPKTP